MRVCAQQLTQAGYSVLVVEKSRGLGGRVATRRLYDTYADRGASSLKPSGELLGRFVELLGDRPPHKKSIRPQSDRRGAVSAPR